MGKGLSILDVLMGLSALMLLVAVLLPFFR